MASTSTSAKLDVATLTRLWLAGIAAFGHRWTSRMGDLPIDDHGKPTIAGALWAKGLAGFSRETVLGALEHFAMYVPNDGWPPDITWMRIRCYGVPSAAEVRREFAASVADRSPFAREVWQRLRDPYQFARASEDAARRMFLDAYNEAVTHVLQGGSLPPPSKAIKPPPPRPYVPARPETVAEAEARIREALSQPDEPVLDKQTRHSLSPEELAAVEYELRSAAQDRKRAAAGDVDDEFGNDRTFAGYEGTGE